MVQVEIAGPAQTRLIGQQDCRTCSDVAETSITKETGPSLKRDSFATSSHWMSVFISSASQLRHLSPTVGLGGRKTTC